MRKALTHIGALAVTVSLVVGCGDDTKDATRTSTVAAATTPPTTPTSAAQPEETIPASTEPVATTPPMTEPPSTPAPTSPPPPPSDYATPLIHVVTGDGWEYDIQIPPIRGVEISLSKSIVSSPPGKAKFVWWATQGNLADVTGTPTLVGRTAPEYAMSPLAVRLLREEDVVQEWKDVLDIGVAYTNGVDCDVLTTRWGTAHYDLSGAYCDGELTGVIDEQNENDEALVDEVLAAFSRSPGVGIVFGSRNSCQVLLYPDGTFTVTAKTDYGWSCTAI